MNPNVRSELGRNPFFGEFGESLTFPTLNECVAENIQLGWKPRTLPDLRREEERYFVSLFLKWRFAYPSCAVRPPLVVNRAGGTDEPDFVMTEGGITFGLEVSRATTWLFQRAMDACRRSESFACVELSPKLNIQSRSDLEYHTGRASLDFNSWVHYPGQPFIGHGWSGSLAESLWADVMAYRYNEKLRKLQKRYRRTVDHCDLLLYSDVPAPTWELDNAVQLLRKTIAERKEPQSSIFFRRVFVVCESWAIFDVLGEKHQIVMKEGWPL